MTKQFDISGAAHATLAGHMRRWAGWSEGTVRFTQPPEEGPPIARTFLDTRVCEVNPEQLIRNPNRVLNIVTPFRLRQEAVLTGVLLHEAAHVRFTQWLNPAYTLMHRDGTPVAPATRALALVMEEPRIEGWMAVSGTEFGFAGLEWTMQAAAAHLLPRTLPSDDEAEDLMNLIQSWLLRAGRFYARRAHAPLVEPRPLWVAEFDNLLVKRVEAWFAAQGVTDTQVLDTWLEVEVMGALRRSVACDHDGRDLLDSARKVLDLLFPDGGADSAPEVKGGCLTNPGEGEPGEGEPGEGEPGEAELSDLGRIEAAADEAQRAESSTQADAPEPPPGQPSVDQPGPRAGTGGAQGTGGWVAPTKDDRAIQRGAERFLRDLVDPSQTTTLSLSDSPSARVDGAALAAWKAAGRTAAPRFFVRTRREERPTPPVRIAVLVDISASMEPLQRPSALLSWALSTAATDLRNFAGRGRQVESCLIHWGSHEVVTHQRSGETLPGIRELRCSGGTSLMGAALDRVEEELPGFFDTPEQGQGENRLLVQFTDWELSTQFGLYQTAKDNVHKALASGVNMLTITPHAHTEHNASRTGSTSGRNGLSDIRLSKYPDIVISAPGPGRREILVYDPKNPDAVWDTATSLLR